MRRTEFAETDPKILSAVLQSSKIGHLAFLREGQLELLPYNFIYQGSYLYFHSSPQTGLAKVVGQKVKFLAYDQVAWIPSTWRHPELACPATTYFRSLSLYSTLELVEDLPEKAMALEEFMQKYQRKDPYKALSEAAYEGPLKALFVGKMRVESPVCKLKMGQHLTGKQRAKVYQKLIERSARGDLEVARSMKEANPDLSVPGRKYGQEQIASKCCYREEP